ncbi:MAG: helix-turn-helix transcriptional regulator [Oryzomonas sp.]
MGSIVRGHIIPINGIVPCMKTSVLEILGIRIREQRKALKWTQEELADIAGIDRSYIGGVERGERNITFTMLCKICEALKCEVSDLTSGIPEIQK